MVRVRRANFENWREVLLPEEGLFVHDQPTHASYQGLLAEGKSVVGLEAEIPDGSILVLTPRPLDELRYVMDRLLGPGGCPWDQEQTHESLKRCWRTGLRMLVHARAYCAWASPTTEWDFAMFALYGTGTSCTSVNDGKTTMRTRLFRQLLAEARQKAKKKS